MNTIMKKQEQLIAEKFNQAALTYDHHANIQARAGFALINHILSIKRYFPNVLDAGCGTGLTSRALASSINYESFLAIDTAEAALQRAAESAGNISYLPFNYNDITTAASYDLIFSNLALHWSHSLTQTLIILHHALTNKGLLAFSIPLHGTFSEISDCFSTHEFISMTSATALIYQSGYKLRHASQLVYTETFPDTLTALRSIKLTGTSHVRHRRQKSLRSKTCLKQHSHHQLSYVIGFYIAEKTNE
jgi:malonyl-CoA O-methyltransferase